MGCLVSVFTPVHPEGLKWLGECYASLLTQTIPTDEWEWVIVENEGAVIPEEIRRDPHVKVYSFLDSDKPPGAEYDGSNPAIGAKKRFCCDHCRGDVYFELDCDDMVTPDALARTQAAVMDGAGFVYSDFAEFVDETWAKRSFNAAMFWEEYDFEFQGHALNAQRAWPPLPQSFLSIHFAPNHLRAWSRDAYWAAGGHQRHMTVSDDHAINVQTYIHLGEKGCRHLTDPLYIYRIHGDGSNTCHVHNKAVRELSQQTCDFYICDVAMRWSKDHGLRMLDLGSNLNPIGRGMETVDIRGGDVTADLNGRWPFDDSSVGVVRAHHVLEHLRDPVHAMNELYRVLAPGAFALIQVPSTDGRGAFQDPSHVSFWNENSFLYYTSKTMAKFAPEFTGRFQAWTMRTYDPGWGNKVLVTDANLVALKPPYDERPVGGCQI